MFGRFSCLMTFVALVSTSAWSADPPSPPAAAPDIVVKGVTAHAMDTYVRQVIAPGDREQIARWNRPVCIRVMNLDSPHADAVESRIAAIGRQVGVQIANKPCKANVLVVATTDPDGALKQIQDGYPQLFRFRDNGDRPVADYKDLLKPEPVRWINGTERLSADGGALSIGTLADSSLAASNLPTNRVDSPASLDSSTREDSALSIAVVDVRRLQGIGTGQLSDYLAMVVFSHPRFGAPFKGGTIMALFADRDAGAAMPDAMTAMDMSLLKNLYSTANLRTADQQRASIEFRMRHPEWTAQARKEADALASRQ